MAHSKLDDVISHWDCLLEGFHCSTQQFYDVVEQAIAKRKIPDTQVSRVELYESGFLSAKRLYLRVWRKNHFFDICGAPFGNSFFFSWWLSEPPIGCFGICLALPLLDKIAWVFAPRMTYFKYDTALMFQESVHSAVLEVVDHVSKTKGIRALSEGERKPVMRNFFDR
ncbi:MAG: hypothetical protein AMXMBFR84_42360 [Candidatus Hydrogenedentota bacterium]